MAEIDERPSDDNGHFPGPSIWPFGFALGVAVALVALILGTWIAAAIGVIVAVVFAALWIREATREMRGEPAPEPPEAAAAAEADAEAGRAPLHAQRLPRGRDAGHRRRDRRRRHAPGHRLRGHPGVRRAGSEDVNLGPLSRLPGGPVDGHEVQLRGRPAGGRRQPHRLHPQQRPDVGRPAERHDPLEPLRPPRVPRAADRAQRGAERGSRSRAARSSSATTEPSGFALPVPRRRVRPRGQPRRRPARARARPLLVLDRRRQPHARPALLRRRGRPAPGADAEMTVYKHQDPGTHVDGPGSTSTRYVPMMAKRRSKRQQRRPGRRGPDDPGRLARGALGSRRRTQVLPLPQGPGRDELVPHARLGDADRLHRPAHHGRDPRDVLQAGSGDRLPVDPAHHERPHARLARPRHAPLGRERLHHPALPPHGPRVPVRRVQVPARAELADRRQHPPARDARGLQRLPAPVGSDGVLGDGRRHQHQRDRADRRAVHLLSPPRRGRDRGRHASALLCDPHAAGSRRADRAHHAAPVPRHPPRDHAAAVDGRREPDRERQRRRARAAQGLVAPARAARSRTATSS